MFQLVYIYTARTPIDHAMCDDILKVSRANNHRANVTGLLVAGSNRFLQALEGPPAAVRAAYARIAADPRHFACVLLGERQLDTRTFGDWAMGYCASGTPTPGSTELAGIVRGIVAPLDDATLRAHFVGFADIQSRAA